MPSCRAPSALVLVLAMLLTPRGAAGDDEGLSEPTCVLQREGARATETATCIQCHDHGPGAVRNHAVDVDYAAAAAMRTGGMGLRPADEVVRRGVYLAEGKVDCFTCHDPRSPWRYHIALPPGVKPLPAVNVRDPSTYEDGPARAAKRAEFERAARGGTSERLEVTPKPLCLACHDAD